MAQRWPPTPGKPGDVAGPRALVFGPLQRDLEVNPWLPPPSGPSSQRLTSDNSHTLCTAHLTGPSPRHLSCSPNQLLQQISAPTGAQHLPRAGCMTWKAGSLSAGIIIHGQTEGTLKRTKDALATFPRCNSHAPVFTPYLTPSWHAVGTPEHSLSSTKGNLN